MAVADREKALEAALAQIEKHHGKGSVMRLGDQSHALIEVIPTGSIALDVALGIGGLPRGRVVEIYGPESAARRRSPCTPSRTPRPKAVSARSSMPSTRSTSYAAALGVDTDALLVSQPTTVSRPSRSIR